MTDSEAPRRWRCFVAVPLPADLREALGTWVTNVREDGTMDVKWRWADPAGWHITLAFLGPTAPDAIAELGHGLARALRDQDAFAVTAGGLGAFPNRSRGKVLWYGIRDLDGRLADLARVVQDVTDVDDERFRPHVTLARARDRHGTPVPALAAASLPEARLAVESVHLMRSHLGHRPARYETLVEFPLTSFVPAGLPA